MLKSFHLVFITLLGNSLGQDCTGPDKDIGLAPWSKPETWPDAKVPVNGDIIEIVSEILLDDKTADLRGVKILNGGRLVFSSEVDLAMLTSDSVYIGDGGALEIGSDSCKFSGNAEILLTGKKTSADEANHPQFGQKFIAVDVGGSLEIHGEEKNSWTFLTQTLNPKQKSFVTDSNVESTEPTNKQGLNIWEFNRDDGTLVQIIQNLRTAKEVENAFNLINPSSVLVISKYRQVSCGLFKEKRFIRETLEELLDKAAGTLSFDQLTMEQEAYLLMVDMSTKDILEDWDMWGGDTDVDGSQTKTLTMVVNDVVYKAQTTTNPLKKSDVNFVAIETYNHQYYEHDIQVNDAANWKAGDKIVIASTDFDWEQAETFDVLSVDGNTIRIGGEVDFMHYGEIDQGVDMRAEVGSLSRNIKIHGKMETSCYGPDCESYAYDTFGGHTMAVEGFASYNIDGAELFDMGQAGVLGRYPIHFHMALDTMRNGVAQTIKNNAIHHTYQRCVTIHTSHNVRILNNIAYDHIGHCFFLEDGAELNTWIEGNLGLGSRKGLLIPSDNNPSTFWITNPLTTLINNRAAGSVKSTGTGFWFLFPDEPVGPSTALGIFEKLQAKYTPINEFKNNVAHSNGHIGLALFRRLDTNHGIIDCSTYSPRVDPSLKKDSELQPITFDGFVGYKNTKFNAILRSTSTIALNFRVAESLVGVHFVRNMLGGYQMLKDSIVIGESNNKGTPVKVRISESGVSPSEYVEVDRSYPEPWNGRRPLIGVEIRAEGPTHLENVDFINFKRNAYREATAIAFYDEYKFHNGAVTSAKGLTFNYAIPDEGFGIYEFNEINGRADSSIMISDVDGSLTQRTVAAGENLVVVKPNMYFSEGDDSCTPLHNTNLVTCKARYSKFYVWPLVDDITATYLSGPSGGVGDVIAANMRISYTVSNGDEYVLNWNSEMPRNFKIKMSGMGQGDTIIIGLCLPLNVKDVATEKVLYMEDGTAIVEASSLDDLRSSTTANVFRDPNTAVVYRKFTETRERTADDVGDCIGGLNQLNACQMLGIKLGWAVDNSGLSIDLNDGQCDSR